MPQIGEAFNVALILDSKMDCPFSHEDVEKLTIENDLIGVGSTLQTRLKGPTPTYHKNSPVFEKEKNKILNPKDVAKHPFHRKNQPAIRLDLGRKGEDDVDIVAYKVSCAAHHLIPAQESLKQSKLEEYLLKKGTTGPGGRAGKCRDDVGYDVNGSQNGVYLPGPYAVTGKKAGRKNGYRSPIHRMPNGRLRAMTKTKRRTTRRTSTSPCCSPAGLPARRTVRESGSTCAR